MNSKLEKWITVGALVGWAASMGSLTFLALRTASPTTASRSSLPLAEPSIRLNSQATEGAHRISSTSSSNVADEFWLDSLRNFSTSSKVASNPLNLPNQEKSTEESHSAAPTTLRIATPDSVGFQKHD